MPDGLRVAPHCHALLHFLLYGRRLVIQAVHGHNSNLHTQYVPTFLFGLKNDIPTSVPDPQYFNEDPEMDLNIYMDSDPNFWKDVKKIV